MLITHDLGVIAEMADYVVSKGTRAAVEKGTVDEIFAHPSHPHTIGLMACHGCAVNRLYSILGAQPGHHADYWCY